MYWPDLLPRPVTTLNTPAGMTSWVSLASSSTVSEVVDEGLNTVQSPAASTGASFQAAMRNGKFHGTICPTTPMGSCSTSDIMLPGSISASPVSARSTPAK